MNFFFRKRYRIHPIENANGDENKPEKDLINKETQDLSFKQILMTLLKFFLYLLLYPLMPVMLYIRIIWKDATEEENIKYTSNDLEIANELSQIYVTIESSLQTIFTLWLILRGIIRFATELYGFERRLLQYHKLNE